MPSFIGALRLSNLVLRPLNDLSRLSPMRPTADEEGPRDEENSSSKRSKRSYAEDPNCSRPLRCCRIGGRC